MAHQEVRLHKIPTDLNGKINKICTHFSKHRTQLLRPVLRKYVEENRHLLDQDKACRETTEYRIPMVNDDIANDFARLSDHLNKSTSDLIIPELEKLAEEYRILWDIPDQMNG